MLDCSYCWAPQLDSRASVGRPGHDVAEADDAGGLWPADRAALTGLSAVAALAGRARDRRSHQASRRGLHHRIALGRLDDDIAELLRSGQPAQRVDGQLELLALRCGWLPDHPGGHLEILLADRGDDVRDVDPERRHLVRIEPGAQTVIALPEVTDARDTGQSVQLVLKINGRVVAEKEAVVALIGRNQVHDHQRARRHLLHINALGLNQRRDDRQGE